MSRWLRLSLPWLFLLVALGVSLGVIAVTAPAACDEVPQAFLPGMHTDVSGDALGLYSRCSATNTATGATVDRTLINWSGIVASVTGCIGAWLLGASIGGLVDRPRGLILAGVALLIAAAALATFFA